MYEPEQRRGRIVPVLGPFGDSKPTQSDAFVTDVVANFTNVANVRDKRTSTALANTLIANFLFATIRSESVKSESVESGRVTSATASANTPMTAPMTAPMTVSESEPNDRSRDRGIIHSTFATERYDVKRFVGRWWFGPHFEPSVSIMLYMMPFWVSISIPAIMALWSMIPRVCIHMILFQIPMLVYVIATINVDLARRILFQQETMIYIIWVFVFGCAMIYEFWEEKYFFGHTMFVTLVATDMILIPFFDAFPPKIRMMANYIVLSSALVFMTMWEIALFFDWSKTPNYKIQFGQTIYSSTGIASTSLYNVIALIALNLYLAIRYPNRLTMILSMTEVLTLNEEESDLLRAMSIVSKATSDRNQLPRPFSNLLGRR